MFSRVCSISSRSSLEQMLPGAVLNRTPQGQRVPFALCAHFTDTCRLLLLYGYYWHLAHRCAKGVLSPTMVSDRFWGSRQALQIDQCIYGRTSHPCGLCLNPDIEILGSTTIYMAHSALDQSKFYILCMSSTRFGHFWNPSKTYPSKGSLHNIPASSY